MVLYSHGCPEYAPENSSMGGCMLVPLSGGEGGHGHASAMPVCASSSAKVVESDGGVGRCGTPLFQVCGKGIQSSYGSECCTSGLWVIVSAMRFGSVLVILPNSMIALLVS